MNKEEAIAMEVKPDTEGWYWVKLFQYNKEKPGWPDYLKDWLEFKDGEWDDFGYKDCCCVCEILKAE